MTDSQLQKHYTVQVKVYPFPNKVHSVRIIIARIAKSSNDKGELNIPIKELKEPVKELKASEQPAKQRLPIIAEEDIIETQLVIP